MRDYLILLKWSELHPAPYNRESGGVRSGFDDASLTQMAASIREQGVIEPLIVRKTRSGYEIIAGERRWAAAGRVSRAYELPCVIREATDAEAREINCVENLQREGLHPLEEARGYQDLLEMEVEPAYTLERIAVAIGKSISYVGGRVKLLHAPELAQRACRARKIPANTLLLLARIPDARLALKATVEVCGAGDEAKVLDPSVAALTCRQAKAHLQEHYMVRLRQCPFDPEDAELVPLQTRQQGRMLGGKCSDCPHRTGNQKALFADVESSDVCTNPACFRRKRAADWERERERVKETGTVLLRDGVAAKLFKDGRLVSPDYVDLDAPVTGREKTWNDVLGERRVLALTPLMVQAREQGHLHTLLPRAAALRAARQLKLKVKLAPPAVPRAERITAKPSRVTLKQNHNGRWALRMGDLELQALRRFLKTGTAVRWPEAALVDALRRLEHCLH